MSRRVGVERHEHVAVRAVVVDVVVGEAPASASARRGRLRGQAEAVVEQRRAEARSSPSGASGATVVPSVPESGGGVVGLAQREAVARASARAPCALSCCRALRELARGRRAIASSATNVACSPGGVDDARLVGAVERRRGARGRAGAAAARRCGRRGRGAGEPGPGEARGAERGAERRRKVRRSSVIREPRDRGRARRLELVGDAARAPRASRRAGRSAARARRASSAPARGQRAAVRARGSRAASRSAAPASTATATARRRGRASTRRSVPSTTFVAATPSAVARTPEPLGRRAAQPVALHVLEDLVRAGRVGERVDRRGRRSTPRSRATSRCSRAPSRARAPRGAQRDRSSRPAFDAPAQPAAAAIASPSAPSAP